MMQKTRLFISRLAFWATVPFLHVYLRYQPRTRILVMADGKVLVLRGWLSDGSWSLPGGGLHRRENPKQGVARELYEETGIQLAPDKIQPLGIAQQNQHGLKFTYHQFFAMLNKPAPLKPRHWEIIEAQWLPLESLTPKNAQAHTLDTIAAWRAEG